MSGRSSVHLETLYTFRIAPQAQMLIALRALAAYARCWFAMLHRGACYHVPPSPSERRAWRIVIWRRFEASENQMKQQATTLSLRMAPSEGGSAELRETCMLSMIHG